MNIFDVFKELDDDYTKKFTNGWNTIKYGPDAYEFTVTDNDGNSIVILVANWKEKQ